MLKRSSWVPIGAVFGTALPLLLALSGCGQSSGASDYSPSFEAQLSDSHAQLAEDTSAGQSDASPLDSALASGDINESSDGAAQDAILDADSGGSAQDVEISPDGENPDGGLGDTDATPDGGTTPDSNAACTFKAESGPSGTECPVGESCIPEVGICKGEIKGLCKKLKKICPTQTNPVCGCDGNTYINVCQAQKVQVIIEAGGECKPPVLAPCGGQTGGLCPMGQVCDIEGCEPKSSGFCQPEPPGGKCPNGGVSECGCDDKTYPNSCYRRVAGVAKKQSGECPITTIVPCKIGPAGKVIGNCGPNAYCKVDSSNANTCLGDGVCSPIPPVCDQKKSPVCSCGGFSNPLNTYVESKTYSNPCELAKIAINMKSVGSCGGTGGCTEGLDGGCLPSEYCGVPKGACGTKGICIPKPPAPCPNTIDLVCGCDGKTYSNAGCAAEAGIVASYDGACKTP